MLSMRQKKALTAVVVRRYGKALKKQKTEILDEFVKNTNYNRSYARRLLCQSKNRDFRKKTRKIVVRKKTYDLEVIQSLTIVWSAMDNICGKRLQPFIPEVVRILERDSQLEISGVVKNKLLRISPATIDRILCPVKEKYKLKGKSSTKPGSLLKSQITIRTFADWEDDRPGFFEMDTVAFCGGILKGHHVWGLNFTDVKTGWVGLDAVMGKGQHGIHQATEEFKTRLVFPILGLDSDNGSEFINDVMTRFCETNRITFTRIRPGKKNDNCYVEQKNFTTLRRFLGYGRYDTPEELVVIKKILNTNQKQQLHKTYENLNPMILLKEIRQLQTKLTKLNRYKLDEATNR